MAKTSKTWLAPVVISLALVSAAGVAWVALPSANTTVTVGPSGAQYKTIQAAVDAAPDGGTIQIAAGTYKENVTIRNRTGLTLQGASQATVTLDGNGLQQTDIIPGILIDKSASITLRNLTITNSRVGVDVTDSASVALDACALDHNLRAGIRSANSQVEVQSCVVRGTTTDQDATYCEAIYIDSNSQAILDRDVISDNADGIRVGNAHATITDCQITRTQHPAGSKNSSSALFLWGASETTVTGTTISDNYDSAVVIRDSAQAELTGNTITNNNPAGMGFNPGGILVGLNASGTTATVEISGNTISGTGGCGVYINTKATGIHISGQGNTISGNSPNLCPPGKFPQGFGGGR